MCFTCFSITILYIISPPLHPTPKRKDNENLRHLHFYNWTNNVKRLSYLLSLPTHVHHKMFSGKCKVHKKIQPYINHVNLLNNSFVSNEMIITIAINMDIYHSCLTFEIMLKCSCIHKIGFITCTLQVSGNKMFQFFLTFQMFLYEKSIPNFLLWQHNSNLACMFADRKSASSWHL